MCAMGHRLRLKRFPPRAELETGTARSAGIATELPRPLYYTGYKFMPFCHFCKGKQLLLLGVCFHGRQSPTQTGPNLKLKSCFYGSKFSQDLTRNEEEDNNENGRVGATLPF